ncbi:hypothetical protein P8452_45216 [Trifolium repens]|nr:hypothetical protein P8452_45216 [Trifolium repens]
MGKEVRKRFLLKTEPSEWSWEDQEANGGISKWDGVKNKQAQKYLKSMSLNDLCFFYHSGSKARRIVGVVSVIREWLSVVPVPDLIWDTICHLGGGYHGDGNPEPNPTD